MCFNDISANLQRGNAKGIQELIQQAIQEGMPPQRILNEGLLAQRGFPMDMQSRCEILGNAVLSGAFMRLRSKQLQRLRLAEDERKLQTKLFVKLCVWRPQG